MPYTTEDGGRLNNFAREPKIYQQRLPPRLNSETIFCGELLLHLVGGLIFVASPCRVCKLTLLAS